MIELKGERFYTLQEIADLLHMHINSIRNYVKQGKLPASKVGRSYLVKEEYIERLVKGDGR